MRNCEHRQTRRLTEIIFKAVMNPRRVPLLQTLKSQENPRILTRACPEVPTVFQLFETRSHVEGLQKQDMQCTQLWKATQQAFAQRPTEEENNKECLKCHNGSEN